MSVGARDYIDRKLVSMYANTKTNNFELAAKIDPEKMMDSMSLMAMNNKSYLQIKRNMEQRKSDLREIA
jgi:hypothetical protein